MKAIKLSTLLNKEGKQKTDKIKWAYYGYGIFNCSGEHELKDLPYEVKTAKCFSTENSIYHVDGAL